jgi:hypothetical protein
MESYCAGKKSKINHNTIDDMLTYRTPPGEFGGITEFGRSNLPIGKRYNLITDAHPSSNSYYVFYQNILKKWFIENGILLNESYNQNYEILLNNIFNFEYIKFMNTLSVPQNQNEKVSKLAYNVVYENKIENVDYMIKKFKEINNNL